jgi:23S rRNA pseudouridine955/2504/2580 synthase
MKALSKEDKVVWLTADENVDGQRVDNLLARVLKGVPRTHLYQLMRTGQVRVNSSRIEPTYRVAKGDRIRVPPVRLATRPAAGGAVPRSMRTGSPLNSAVLFEDDYLLVLNKPAGMAVHGGSGISRGVIEELRALRPAQRFLELVHRLDRGTSGVLLLAKKRSALLALHEQMRMGRVAKRYRLLVKGRWPWETREMHSALQRYVLPGGDRRVRVSDQGQASRTIFHLVEQRARFSLLDAELMTGRTHQIRVHAAAAGHPIAGDDKYGDFQLNKELARDGLKRIFLHAMCVEFEHPANKMPLRLVAALPEELQRFLDRIIAAPGNKA